ncbi:hypothetical protein ILUMI_01827, partial [Ignelater luminosus]
MFLRDREYSGLPEFDAVDRVNLSRRKPLNNQQLLKKKAEEPLCSFRDEINNLAYPDCWNEKAVAFFTEQYKWLQLKAGKLGCKDCSTILHLGVTSEKHVHVSKEWSTYSVTPNGNNKTTHGKIQVLLRESANEAMPNLIHKVNNKQIEATVKIFNTVYSLIKRNRPLSDVEAALDLQKKMNAKVCIIIDEASTVSRKSTLVIYLNCAVQSAPEPVMLFVALKEPMSTTTECIFNTLLSTLNDCGFHNEYLKANLIAFCSDGASTMLGRKSGVAAKLLESFPKIIVWHCLNHRLQLSIDDSISEIKHVNHFKIFLDKIYCVYHQSNKNQTELETIAKELEIEIIKIGRVLGPRWAACSLRATIARLANINFLQDLALMIDILEEFSLLSTALQSRSTNIHKVQRLIKRTIRALENLKMGIGKHESQVEDLIKSEKFRDIPFNRSNKFIVLPRTMLLENIIQHMNLRLLSDRNNNEEIFHYFDLLEPATWPYEEITSPWTAAERKLNCLSEILKYPIDLNDFRDFVDSNIESKNDPIPATIQKAKKIVSTIAISSAEAERGFSLMNTICTK